MTSSRQQAYEAGEPDLHVNPDPRCHYPPTQYDPLDYCWAYAEAVDAGRECDCRGCDLWYEESVRPQSGGKRPQIGGRKEAEDE